MSKSFAVLLVAVSAVSATAHATVYSGKVVSIDSKTLVIKAEFDPNNIGSQRGDEQRPVTVVTFDNGTSVELSDVYQSTAIARLSTAFIAGSQATYDDSNDETRIFKK